MSGNRRTSQSERALDECRIDAARLHKEFQAGNAIAPFECAFLWRKEGLSASTLPSWVLHALAFDVAATFYRSGRGALLWNAFGLKPKKRLPSLDVIAGVKGNTKHNAWWKANRLSLAKYFVAATDAIVAEAKTHPQPSHPRYINSDGTFPRPEKNLLDEWAPVRVLNKRGEPSRKFSVELARQFGLSGHSGQAIYQTVLRLRELSNK